MFDAQVAALAPEYRVITWDQRGHGGTPAPGPFSYWDSARDVLALLDHLGIEEAVLGGMSQGGFLSLRAAMLAPQRVRGLVLIDSQGGTEAEASRPAYEQLHQTWLDEGPVPVQEIVAAIILGPGQWDGWYAKWAEQYAQWAPGNLSQLTWPFRCLMDRDDITGRLGEVSLPGPDRPRQRRRRDPAGQSRADARRPSRADHVHRYRRGSARIQRDPSRRGQRRDREVPAPTARQACSPRAGSSQTGAVRAPAPLPSASTGRLRPPSARGTPVRCEERARRR